MTNKPRKWWIAGLLSLIEPGLGQIYNGQARKGITILVLCLLLSPLMLLCLHAGNIVFTFLFLIIVTIGYYACAIVDAIVAARKLRVEYTLKKYNKVIVYIGIFVAVIIINTVLFGGSPVEYVRQNHVQAFRIPASSMEPALMNGDYILVDRRPSERNPKHGDLIVFAYPRDPEKDFVKRVVALGGETVLIRDKQLLIDGKLQSEPYAFYDDPNILSATPRDNFGPVTVPSGSFFVLGDNRDHSYDGRFWGFVEQGAIKGIVKGIYWSWDGYRQAVRWDRIGTRMP